MDRGKKKVTIIVNSEENIEVVRMLISFLVEQNHISPWTSYNNVINLFSLKKFEL